MINREKYSGCFKDCLEQSRDLTNYICSMLDDEKRFPNVYCQDQFDQFPFVGNGGKKIRFADLLVLDFNIGGTFFIEAKDFASLVFYDCTGLPRCYVDERLIPLGIRNVYLVFRENEETFLERKKYEKQIYFTELSRARKNNELRKLVFVPYGERLDVLMRNRNKEAEKKITSNLSSYKGESQYMWNLSCCKPIKEVFLRDFGSME